MIGDHEMHLVAAGEVFYLRLRRILPEKAIKQIRLGYDKKGGTPCIMCIMDHNYDEKYVEVMEMGTNLDLEMYNKYEYHVQYWVITDHKLDMPLIEADFPYLRSVVSRYEEDTEDEKHTFPPYGMSCYSDKAYDPGEFVQE